MLNYETLLSNYNDKLTLMQWLKKVEEALKDASATEFKVNKKGNATISFSIVFEDGTELESGDIVLQQGESVASAAIVNGHLKLTLTNGDVLDAGNLGAVTDFEIDASQHLIIHYQDGTTQDLGAIFSGNVNIAGNLTADSIIENMAGYSVSVETGQQNWTPIYVGMVKTGNKLTIVVFGSFTYVSGGHNAPTILYAHIPSSVGDKLFPYSGNVLHASKVDLLQGISVVKELPYTISKGSNTLLTFDFRSVNSSNLDNGETYLFRIETTFLLGDNLAA